MLDDLINLNLSNLNNGHETSDKDYLCLNLIPFHSIGPAVLF